MSKVDNYTKFAEAVAADNSHGYDQIKRMGNPDYDCSGLVITAVTNAGIDVKSAGATYTGNMLSAFKKAGFKDITKNITLSSGKGLIRGDILLSVGHHTAIYVGDGKLVHASINEKGGITGGKSGDQTGKEICVRTYYNHPWSNVLRYTEAGSSTTNSTTTTSYTPTFKVGDKVTFKGCLHYTTSSSNAIAKGCKSGLAQITAIKVGAAHPYHLKALPRNKHQRMTAFYYFHSKKNDLRLG